MKSIEKMIDFALSKHKKVSYNMSYPQRLGPFSYDCSSFVYYCLIAGGFLPRSSRIGNTETLYKLKGDIFEEIYSYDEIRRGDIFICGVEGRSYGAYGHTGIFLDKNTIIHCNWTNRGVSINGKNSYIGYYLDQRRSEAERYFRLKVKSPTPLKKPNKMKIATTRTACNVRVSPSLNSQIVAIYPKGSTIYYDKIVQNENYKWISYIGNTSHKRRYVAFEDKNKYRWIDLS